MYINSVKYTFGGYEVMHKEVTNKVTTGGVVLHALDIKTCVCGRNFTKWQYVISKEDFDIIECYCGAKLYFESVTKVYDARFKDERTTTVEDYIKKQRFLIQLTELAEGYKKQIKGTMYIVLGFVFWIKTKIDYPSDMFLDLGIEYQEQASTTHSDVDKFILWLWVNQDKIDIKA